MSKTEVPVFYTRVKVDDDNIEGIKPDCLPAYPEREVLVKIGQGEEVGNPDFAEDKRYTASGISQEDKFTIYAQNCLVVAFLGKNREEENVSMLLHISPLGFYHKRFLQKDYPRFLQEFASVADCRAVVLSGGYYEPWTKESYLNKRAYVVRANHEILGMDTFVFPAKRRVFKTSTNVFVETQKPAVYVVETSRINTKASFTSPPGRMLNSNSSNGGIVL